MATTMYRPSTVPLGSREDRPIKRKKEARSDIWSSLLRQTREAQARSRTQAVQHRQLILCGGSPDDQRSFLQSLARPPPPQPQGARNARDNKDKRTKGEVRLSNRYAYGYGHVTLYSPPVRSESGVQVLGAEAEEVARCEVHTVPDAEGEYVGTLKGLLMKKESENDGQDGDIEGGDEEEERRAGVCILLSWKEPWKFLDQLRRWIQLLARALLQPGQAVTDPMDVIKDAQLSITIVVQHTESQEELFREGYKEEDFDYISQCLRTAILPLHPVSSMVYTTSSAPPQQPGGPLSEPQKVVFSSLGLDLTALSPKPQRSGDSPQKQELGPKHEFMDRMAIVIPSGWDSAAFIRTLSETFSPEDVLGAWLADLQPPPEPNIQHTEESNPNAQEIKQANGGAEVFESSPVETDDEADDPPLSPSKLPRSAVKNYEIRILDPQAHKATKAPQIEVTTKPDQKFLAEMREHLQQLEAHDRERESSGRTTGVSTTSLSNSRLVGMPSGDSTGALNELGDVSFNVGGVSYDTVSAEAAIERLKRHPTTSASQAGLGSPLSPTPRSSTPKPPRATRDEDRRPSADRGPQATPAGQTGGHPKEPSSTSTNKSSEREDLPIDKLEEYFASLMKNGRGGGNKESTPTKPSQ